GPAPSGVSQVDPLPGAVPGEVASDSGAARGAASGGVGLGGAKPGGAGSEAAGSGGAERGGAEPEGAEPAGVEPRGAEPEGVELGGAESEGAESRGAEPRGAALSRGPAGALQRLSPRPETLSPQQLLIAGAGGTGGAAAAGLGGARSRGARAAGARGARAGGTSAGGAGAGGAKAGGAGAGGTGAGGAGAGGAGAVDPGAGGAGAGSTGAGGTVRPRPYFVPLLQQSVVSLRLVLPPLFALVVAFLVRVLLLSPAHTLWHFVLPLFHCVFVSLLLLSPLFLPSPTLSLTELVLPVPLSLVSSVVTDPSFESTTASALVAELVDFDAACLLDYATALVAESESASPPSVGGECALGTDVLEDRQEDFECLAAAVPRFASMLLAPEGDPDAPDIPTPRSYAEAITSPYSSQWQAAMDAEMASWKSTGTYVNIVPPSQANVVDGMWIFRVKRPLGSPPAFKAHYIARGFSQRQGVDYFQTFSPTPKMTTLWVLLHVASQRDYELHPLEFSTAFLQGSLHEEIWLHRPPGFTESFFSVARHTEDYNCGSRFTPSTADPLLFLHTDTSLPPFYVLVYVDDLIFAIAETEALTLVKSELQKRHTCTDLGELRSYLGLQITRDRARRTITLTQSHMVHQVLQRFGFYTSGMGLVLGGRGLVVLTGHADASWVDDSATQRSSQGYTFSLGAMAAQELRWLTYLLTDLGEQPLSPPVLYVDNKAMIALCQEHRLEHITKHIALQYFLARELQQRGQLRLAYVASRANTADIFTKALPPGEGAPGFPQQQALLSVLWGGRNAGALPLALPTGSCGHLGAQACSPYAKSWSFISLVGGPAIPENQDQLSVP
ncbi:unnamed protein product, partial [Closterium sp. NIES-54]